MPTYVIPAPATVSVPVAGGGDFPVRRVFCVGRNYAEHQKEMGHSGEEPPFFFTKPPDALVTGGADTPYPPATTDLHHEIELVAAIGADGSDIAADDALGHVFGYAAGIDLTRRDIQAIAKKAGPAVGHGQGLRPLRPHRRDRARHPHRSPRPRRASRSRVNGTVRQSGDIGDMIWPLARDHRRSSRAASR